MEKTAPGNNLLLAILNQAIADCVYHSCATTEEQHRAAIEFCFGSLERSGFGFFSFSDLCSWLRLEPATVRRAIELEMFVEQGRRHEIDLRYVREITNERRLANG